MLLTIPVLTIRMPALAQPPRVSLGQPHSAGVWSNLSPGYRSDPPSGRPTALWAAAVHPAAASLQTRVTSMAMTTKAFILLRVLACSALAQSAADQRQPIETQLQW